MTLDDILVTWPEYADEVRKKLKGNVTREWASLTERLKQGAREESGLTGDSCGTSIKSSDVFDRVNNLFLVWELWERKYRDDGMVRHQPYMNLRVALPYLNLCLGNYDLPLKYYPFVLQQMINFGSTIIDTRSYVDQLRPIQEEKNRENAIAEDAASRGIAESLILGAGEDQLKTDIAKGGSKPGVYVAATDNPVAAKINSSGVNTGVQYMIKNLDDDFEKISILPPAVGGAAENASESGSYFNQKVQQGELGVEVWSFIETRRVWKVLWRLILERIQAYYTPEMTLRILGEEQGKFEEVSINQVDWVTGKILNDVTLGNYDIVIDDVEFSNSTRWEQLRVLSDVLKGAPPQIQAMIWPEYIRNLPLDRRNEFAAMAQQALSYMLAPPPPMGETASAKSGAQSLS
jgi:hypothetical protein